MIFCAQMLFWPVKGCCGMFDQDDWDQWCRSNSDLNRKVKQIKRYMEKFMMAAGTALRVLDTEKGDTTVVLLHGYLEMIEVWEELAGALQANYRVVAIDLPGMGVSQVQGEVHTMEFMAEVLTGVLDKLQVERCFLVGHSMGGYVAEAFAAVHPERVQGLVLLHSTPNADTEHK